MTAIVNPPPLPINRPFWAPNGSSYQPVGSAQQSDDFSRFSRGGKPLERSNSISSVSSTSSTSSVSTVLSAPHSNGSSASSNGDVNINTNTTWIGPNPRKRPQVKAPWTGPQKNDKLAAAGRVSGTNGGIKPVAPNGMLPAPMLPQQGLNARQGGFVSEHAQLGQVAISLLSINGTFDRKTILVPFFPDTLRIGRQTNQKTLPTSTNGYFDSKVLSRQHAEIWADRNTGKVFIRDVKSSNGTFVNGSRLSLESRESEPHELNQGDNLELGIDIVHEDQKTVVHHKVAAKVEHVGFTSAMPELYSGDLDPSGLQGQGMGGRGRAGSNQSMRMAPTVAGMIGTQSNVMGPSRPIWMAQITTDQIVKRLHQEMRSSRLQAQDLLRTGHFIGALLTKQDVKELGRPDAPEPPRSYVNGNNLGSFHKPRFSDPPAPPPQQPLPEKPDVTRSGEFALKRGITERPKGQKENPSQASQLAEDLRSAKKQPKSVEEMLSKERGAREELAKKPEVAAAKAIATATKIGGKELDDAFNPPTESFKAIPQQSPADATATLQDRIDGLVAENLDLKQQLLKSRPHAEILGPNQQVKELKQQLKESQQQLKESQQQSRESQQQLKESQQQSRESRQQLKESQEQWKEQLKEFQQRAEKAEEEAQSLKKQRVLNPGTVNGSTGKAVTTQEGIRAPKDGESKEAPMAPLASLSRSSTVTPTKSSGQLAQRYAMTQALPYASMLSVVVLGMGLMAYLNGWQPGPRLAR